MNAKVRNGDTVDFRQLRYFVAVVEAGSVTDAARRLHVVQPAVSQRIADLENGLGVQLLIRTRQGVTPTSAGLELYSRARSIIKQVAVAANATRERGGIVGGRVSIGLLRSVSRILAVPLFQELRAALPAVVPEIVVGYSESLVQRVNATNLDLALRVLKSGEAVAGCLPLFSESLCLVGSPRLLRGQPPEIALSDAGGIPLLISPTQPIHGELQVLAQEAGVHLNTVGSIESSEAIEQLCRSGYAATFLSEMTARALARAPGRKLLLVRVRGFERSICIYSHPEIPKSSSVQACEQVLRQIMLREHARLHAQTEGG